MSKGSAGSGAAMRMSGRSASFAGTTQRRRFSDSTSDLGRTLPESPKAAAVEALQSRVAAEDLDVQQRRFKAWEPPASPGELLLPVPKQKKKSKLPTFRAVAMTITRLKEVEKRNSRIAELQSRRPSNLGDQQWEQVKLSLMDPTRMHSRSGDDTGLPA